ncbi:MAG TPA: pyridoxamine 5'-phosphate oxidase [Cyclobacteriaceae bacterium]|jgi:pyridoxamine 5'-phosphate oxidase
MHNLADLRREYTRAALELPEGDADPLRLLQSWLDEAIKAEALEPNAMTLSTVNEHGRPRARIVLLKGITDGKLEFYTNYQSDKGLELEKNPACALTFFWPEIERQVRIEGVADRLSPEKSDEYFQSRPRGSQMGAWASPQSTPIANRRILEERFTQLEKKFGQDAPIPRPRQWGGFGVEPYVIEFWQGRANRLHDRICYTRKNNTWEARRLAP